MVQTEMLAQLWWDWWCQTYSISKILAGFSILKFIPQPLQCISPFTLNLILSYFELRLFSLSFNAPSIFIINEEKTLKKNGHHNKNYTEESMLKLTKSITAYNHQRTEDHDPTCQISNSLGLFVLEWEISAISDNTVWGSEKHNVAGTQSGALPFHSYLNQCYMGLNTGIRRKVV